MAALTNSQTSVLVGRAEPRLATAPLRELTPATTLGFEFIEFSRMVLKVDLMPWQCYWALHALETTDDGAFRFATVLTLVGRQSGKTTLLKCLALYLMFTGRVDLVLGAAQSLDIARESWNGAVEMIEGSRSLTRELAKIRRANGEQEIRLTNGSRYKIAAANRSSGRGLSVGLLVLDELREHRTWEAWAALSKTTMAQPNALTICISNAGDDESVVLNSLRANALDGDDETLGIFEWSAPEDCDVADPEAWSQGSPGLGHTITARKVQASLATDSAAVFRTEVLCQHVESMADMALSAPAWESCKDQRLVLDAKAGRMTLCFDVGMNSGHASLAAAQLGPDDRVRVTMVASWSDVRHAVRELEEWKKRLKPSAFAYFPDGPAAAVAADLDALKLTTLSGREMTSACQEFATLVNGRGLLHNGDPLMTAHVLGAKKWKVGDGWRFVRRGVGHVDAAYAAAGAARLARTLPPPKKIMLVASSS